MIAKKIIICFFVPLNAELSLIPKIMTAQILSPNILYVVGVFNNFAEIDIFKKSLLVARFFTVIDVLKREEFVPG